MFLSASTLAGLIKTNLAGATDAATANMILGDTITNYLLSNTVFSFSWAALQTTPTPPSPTPDPVTSATGAFISLTITITPSGATDSAGANESFKNQLIAGMTDATYNITDPGFTTTANSMTTSTNINNLVLTPGGETNQDAALLDRCTKIIDWVKQLAPTGTCNGTRTDESIVYTGTGTVTSIS